MPRRIRATPELSDEQKSLYWAKVDKRGTNDCWKWTAYRNAKGYGSVGVNRVTYLATRIGYFLATGHDPGELCVCHKCDNPACCNPRHFFLGTHRENVDDMHRKGRHAWGSRQPGTPLKESDVVAIRQSDEKDAVLAEKYGVTFQTISDICLGKRWKLAGGPIRAKRKGKK